MGEARLWMLREFSGNLLTPVLDCIMRGKNSWTQLDDCTSTTTEKELQQVFDEWDGNKGGLCIAGAPKWLLDCGKPEERRSYGQSRGRVEWAFWPDVLWKRPEYLVVELKRSPQCKYEELALAEVLHHAWRMGDPNVAGWIPPMHPRPVIVASRSPWLRSALTYLFHYGLKRDRLKYLEATYLTDPNGDKYIWLEEPFAGRLLSKIPSPPIPKSWSAGCRCYSIENAKSWALFDKSKIPDDAAPLVPEEFIFVSSIAGTSNHLVRLPSEGQAVTYLATQELFEDCETMAPDCPFAEDA